MVKLIETINKAFRYICIRKDDDTMAKTYEDSDYKHWNNYATNDEGTKNEEVRQMNIKDKSTGDHTFYSPSSGAQGMAFGDYRPGRK